MINPRSKSNSNPPEAFRRERIPTGRIIAPMAADSAAPSPNEIATFTRDERRYRRIVWFFSVNFIKALWWEMALRRVFGADFVQAGREKRTRRVSAQFRQLAIDMGGVMIKLGQFISTRVDILPPYVIDEVKGLQDEVPPIPFDAIQEVIAGELGEKFSEFEDFNPMPIAAASLGQVYRARLQGENVVVKVQRPGIREMVYTDLAALETVSRWAMRFRFIARRADVPKLLEEFSAVLWEELDYLAEASNAERFRRMFADDPGVHVPQVYGRYSTKRLLVLEDVSAIKLNDYTALEAAGINRLDVARRLLDTYLPQVFYQHFFHADPHPGNLFVRPLTREQAESIGLQGARRVNGQAGDGTPFQIIYIDYGMMGRLTPQLVETLRQTLVAAGLRDARALVESYERLGVLMPSADKERIIEATRRAFDLVWGLNMDELGNLPMQEMTRFGREFKDLLLSAPFRIPQDLIYLGRAAGILSGMCTGLDPQFDPWREVQPYIKVLMEGRPADAETEKRSRMRETLLYWLQPDNLRALLSEDNLELAFETGQDYARRAIQLPILADEVLRKADRGDLRTHITLDADLQARLDRMEAQNRRLLAGIVVGALAISGSILWRRRE